MGFFDDRSDLGPPPEPFRFGPQSGRPSTPFRWLGLAALVLVGYLAVSVLKSIYVDLLWFDSVGFQDVYQTELSARILLFFAGGLIAIAVLGGNIMLARRFAPVGREESFIEDVDPVAIRSIVTVLLVAGMLFFGVIFGSVAASSWETVLTWLNGQPFGRPDAQFQRDISFYVFTLPAYHFVQRWALSLLLISTIGSGAVYGLSISLQRFELNINQRMRIHLSLLVGAIFIVIAASTVLTIFDSVSSVGGIVHGAKYADVNARIPVRYVLVALALFAAAATMANPFLSAQSFRVPIFAIGLWGFAGLVGGVVYPTIVQSVSVKPSERLLEAPYIERNIAATRFAYGLDRVVETRFPAEQSVKQADLDANPDTLANIRLLDPIPLRDTFNQIQAIRQFYTFHDVDVTRYTLGGKTQQVMAAARELDIARAQGTNWTRDRLQLTHGYGAVIAPVNEVQAEGLPRLITSEIPPKSDLIPITEAGARIYFGERTTQYVVGRSSEPEFDYPQGTGNASTSYADDRGIRLNSLIRRAMLAWELGDANLMIPGQLTADSRLLMHRQIHERVKKVVPFLVLDSDPYMVVIDGRILWMQSAYTASTHFPYSQPSGLLGAVNYIRSSVQITIDAQTGDMRFYLIDGEDPVVKTWARIFPSLFQPNDAIPPAVRAHMRYPLDLFKLQSLLYLRYHITDPSVFFIGEDVWNIPSEKKANKEQAIEPYYVTMALPDEQQAGAPSKVEFVLIMPFTPRNRQNTVAWLAGRSDGASFGKLRAYRFPTEDLVYGPAQIEARIDQNPGISQQITLWNQSGSSVLRGNLLMIPIGTSFLFVEPIYLQAENSKLPELVRVVVANGNQIAMERTFPEALDVVMGKHPSTLPGGQAPQPDSGARPGATPAPGRAPAPGGATPTPRPGATPVISPASIEELLRQAQQSSNVTQQELDRLRAILDAIQRQLQTPPQTQPR
ncbi:MAG: UPF0182 family protein [Dehalococcoidia bacterium]|nr:UPF0182 family protein [Dehalococcoidia bacterium]